MQDLHTSTPTATPARLAVLLRHATADLHRAVESLPVMTRLTSATVTHDDYLDYLRALADVYATLEPNLFGALDEGLQNDLGVRRKLPAILDDLRKQGHPHRPSSANEPSPTGAGTAVGGIYVLEGATLGGRVIAKHLRRCLGATLGPTAFLDFHGEQASAAWKRFAGILDELPANGRVDQSEVIAGARSTFALIHRILGDASSTPPLR
jgi:heme oxygenase (biliverdin-IX-beta and delta-forming)